MKFKISLIALTSILFNACGQSGYTPRGHLNEEVTPIGEHGHFLGELVVKGPAKRKYPDVPQTEGKIAVSYSDALGRKEVAVALNSIPDSGEKRFNIAVLKKQSGLHFIHSISSATFNASYFFNESRISPSKQKFVETLQIVRIDVNPMKITRQNGAFYESSGTYNVFLNENDGSYRQIIDEAPTKTGVDVPAGNTYTVTVLAKSEEGEWLKDVAVLKL